MHPVGHIHHSLLFEILTVPFPLGQEHRSGEVYVFIVVTKPTG
jgi:hypothetical protein